MQPYRSVRTNCPACGQQLATDAAACPVCGRLLASTVCPEHPQRSAEGACVLCGRAVCDYCHQGDTRPYRCPEHRDVPVIEGWAQIYTTSDDLAAQLIRENLQAEGIDAQILSQKDHYAFTFDLGEFSQVRVLVPAFSYAEAQRVLAEHTDARGEVRFACRSCGEAFSPEDRVCRACGAPLP